MKIKSGAKLAQQQEQLVGLGVAIRGDQHLQQELRHMLGIQQQQQQQQRHQTILLLVWCLGFGPAASHALPIATAARPPNNL
jgi:hypothetical protein